MKIIDVLWIDSYALDDSWHSLDEAIPHRILRTVGFVVSENEVYTVIASTWDEDAQSYGNAIAILNTCILVKNELSE